MNTSDIVRASLFEARGACVGLLDMTRPTARDTFAFAVGEHELQRPTAQAAFLIVIKSQDDRAKIILPLDTLDQLRDADICARAATLNGWASVHRDLSPELLASLEAHAKAVGLDLVMRHSPFVGNA